MPKKKTPNENKICSKCGHSNKHSAVFCVECNHKKFEPIWIKAKKSITRNMSVQVTKSNPVYGVTEDRLTLAKWWPGGRSTFHITKPGHWDQIKAIIDSNFTTLLGWETTEKIIKGLESKIEENRTTAANSAIEQHPQLLKDIISSIDVDSFSKKDINSLAETMGEIGDILSGANSQFREAFLSIIKKLPKQKQRALEDLDNLLKTWELHVITNVSQHVKSRLELIDLFEERVQDPKTFEINGDNSIHRILERAMWLVDEKYWLMISNKTIRTFIGGELSTSDRKKYGSKRPDFVCGTVGDQLIILELKRPSHELTIEDLNQLETYVTLAEKYKTFTSCRAYIVGAKASEDLLKRIKHRSASFKILYYSDIITNVRLRYKEYLDSVEN